MKWQNFGINLDILIHCVALGDMNNESHDCVASPSGRALTLALGKQFGPGFSYHLFFTFFPQRLLLLLVSPLHSCHTSLQSFLR